MAPRRPRRDKTQAVDAVFASTAYFLLPLNVGLDDVAVWAYDHGDAWPGWNLQTMAGLMGVPQPLPPGRVPAYRLAFREAEVEAPAVGERAQAAHPLGYWLNASRRERCRERRETERNRGQIERRSVVAVTAYERWVSVGQPTREDLQQRVEDSLAVLNDFLVSLGHMSNDPLVGALALGELPAFVPLSFDLILPNAATGFYIGQMAVHPWQPELLEIPRDDSDLTMGAFIFDSWHRLGDPAFPVLEALHGALRDALAGRPAMAAVAAGGAIELLVGTVVRRAWAPAGLDLDRLEGALNSGFRNVLEKQLPRVLGISYALDDGSAPSQWWKSGYRLRNDVIHDGYRPSADEALSALRSAWELTAFIGAAINDNPDLAHLLGILPTAQIPPWRYAGRGR